MTTYLTTGKFAELLGVSAQTIRNWIEEGRVPGAIKVGERWSIPAGAYRKVQRPARGFNAHQQQGAQPVA